MKSSKFYSVVVLAVMLCLVLAYFGNATDKNQATQQLPVPTKPVITATLQAVTDTTAKAAEKRQFELITQKKNQIGYESRRVRSQEHTVNDLYSLQLQTYNTLEQSHELSKKEMLRNDTLMVTVQSLSVQAAQQDRYAKKLIKGIDDMKGQMLTYREFKREIEIVENFMQKAAYIASALTLLMFLARLVMRRWQRDNSHRLPKGAMKSMGQQV
jgi:hypothetical protein